jgi:hypothetical protein
MARLGALAAQLGCRAWEALAPLDMRRDEPRMTTLTFSNHAIEMPR